MNTQSAVAAPSKNFTWEQFWGLISTLLFAVALPIWFYSGAAMDGFDKFGVWVCLLIGALICNGDDPDGETMRFSVAWGVWTILCIASWVMGMFKQALPLCTG